MRLKDYLENNLRLVKQVVLYLDGFPLFIATPRELFELGTMGLLELGIEKIIEDGTHIEINLKSSRQSVDGMLD